LGTLWAIFPYKRKFSFFFPGVSSPFSILWYNFFAIFFQKITLGRTPPKSPFFFQNMTNFVWNNTVNWGLSERFSVFFNFVMSKFEKKIEKKEKLFKFTQEVLRTEIFKIFPIWWQEKGENNL
jgi:hypothetical protein